jgi:pilus assembly protein CpaC
MIRSVPFHRSTWARAAVAALAFSATALAATSVFAAPPPPAPAGPATDLQEMSLAVNETKTIAAKGIRNYSVADPATIDVRYAESSQQFLVVGKKSGSTTLLLIKDDGTQTTWVINVATRPPEVVYRELQQLLEGDTGVKIRRVGARFFLEGGVTTESEAKRITTIANLYPGQVENLVNVGSGAGDRRTLIRVDFFFVQYDKSSRYGFGIGYPNAIGGDQVGLGNMTFDFLQSSVTAAQAVVTNQILPRLDIAARYGWAKVMKQSSIITSNGELALLNSGGELNFRINSFGSTSAGLAKLPFGTNVSCLPRYDSTSKEIELKLIAEVAELTSNQGGDVPGRNLNRVEVILNMKLGQALILGGFKSFSQTHDIQGIPLLSAIPVLGILFGSHSDLKTEVENAMFVVPSVVDTVPKSALDLIKNATAQFKDYSGDIDSVNTFDRTPPSAKQ